MQKHRYKVSFFLTALLYIIPVGIYLYFLQQHLFSADKPQETTIELSLSQFVPEAPPAESTEPVQEEQLVEEEPEPESEEKPKEEKEPEPEEPLEKEVPKEVVKPEPVVKEVPVPEPVEKKEVVPKPKPVKKKAVKKRKHAKKHPRPKRKIRGGGSPKRSAAAKNRFLSQIRSRINHAKSYPRVAKKRRMQGVVKVRFTILANGHVGNISLSGPKIFYRSARKAVKSAFPVSVKNIPLSLPTVVNLSLRYQLR